LEGSEDSGSSRDERGTLIRFPGSGWIPADGIQPLNGSTRTVDRPDAEEAPDRPERRAAFEAGDFWDSGHTQEFVGATSTAHAEAPGAGRRRSPDFRERILRPRFVSGAIAATALALACAEALGLVTTSSPIRKSSAVSHRLVSTGGRSDDYASTASSASFEARVVASLHLHHSASAAHQARRATRVTHRGVARARSSATRVVPVTYQQAPPVNNTGPTSGEPTSYQPPSPASSSAPQTSATTAIASGGSGSGPARPSPTGALTCISNCG
jgi:hypothetical protein